MFWRATVERRYRQTPNTCYGRPRAFVGPRVGHRLRDRTSDRWGETSAVATQRGSRRGPVHSRHRDPTGMAEPDVAANRLDSLELLIARRRLRSRWSGRTWLHLSSRS